MVDGSGTGNRFQPVCIPISPPNRGVGDNGGTPGSPDLARPILESPK
jgi:hypothetical protein